MAEAPKTSFELSRRSLLHGVACAVCAVPVLLVTTDAAMAAKMAKTAVAYKNSPNGDKKCSVCKNFQPPSGCAIVDGTINENGYCNVWGGVEERRGSLGHAAALRLPSPLVKPDVRISRIRLPFRLHIKPVGGTAANFGEGSSLRVRRKSLHN
jgi:hypothetical protein